MTDNPLPRLRLAKRRDGEPFHPRNVLVELDFGHGWVEVGNCTERIEQEGGSTIVRVTLYADSDLDRHRKPPLLIDASAEELERE